MKMKKQIYTGSTIEAMKIGEACAEITVLYFKLIITEEVIAFQAQKVYAENLQFISEELIFNKATGKQIANIKYEVFQDEIQRFPSFGKEYSERLALDYTESQIFKYPGSVVEDIFHQQLKNLSYGGVSYLNKTIHWGK